MAVNLEQLKQAVLDGTVDFHCFQCNYNLRGLEGDSKRCPECGFVNLVGDFFISSEHIETQLRKMETAPTFLYASTFLMILIAGYLAYSLLATGHSILDHASLLSVCFIFIVPITFIYSLKTFLRHSRMASIGTKRAFSLMCSGMGILVTGMALIGGGLGLSSLPLEKLKHSGGFNAILFLLTMILYYVATIVVMKKLYQKYKSKLDGLLRDVAIELLFEKRRRELNWNNAPAQEPPHDYRSG